MIEISQNKNKKGNHKMRKTVLTSMIIYCMLIGLCSDVLSAQKKECVSLLDTSQELREQFTGDSLYHRLIFEDNFEDNRHQWPVGTKKMKYGKKTYASSVNIKDNKLNFDMATGTVIAIAKGISRDGVDCNGCQKWPIFSSDLLIETCFKILKGDKGFGLVWEYFSDGRGHSLLIKPSGDFAYFKKTYNQKNETKPIWKKSDVIRKGKQYNTLSVLKRGMNLELYINGKLVAEETYTDCGGGGIGFRYSSSGRTKAEISHLIVREAPLGREPAVSDNEIIKMATGGKQTGFMKKINNAYLDLRTNLIWHGKGTRYKFSVILKMNLQNVSGFSDWRLPSTAESETIIPEFKKYTNGRAVRNGPLDLALLLNRSDSQKQDQLSEQQEKIFERVSVAYKTGLEDSGELLFDALLNQAADTLFANNYTRVIAEKNLPLKLAGKLLLAVYDKEKNNPVFWYEYAHLAGLANQSALVLQGARQLTKISYNGDFKEELQDQAAVFEALGYMLLGQDDKAYAALLMRFDLKDNLFIPSYLNRFATPLLKDKSKLAKLIGFDEQFLSGTYAVPEPQSFYNIETRQLVEPVKNTPDIVKETPGTEPLVKTKIKTKTPGATVLD
ncbi:MAG: DUF1566 domain-containing protein [Desulfobacula sp.]|uniref:hypothetical protein n=1 Tax=Desulfobacula sp. TaxID=2593537 RepID=UPI0025C3304F|nr:hypothetical protein [Desulfobacula sp.]MCD4718940.1 DUF1566 domain-containing protein [Desulfobacula sp.]